MTVSATAKHAEAALGEVRGLLARPAVVLERIARGGGRTEWYWCRTAAALDAVAARLSPGSVVSFYFDDRIRSTTELQTVAVAAGRLVCADGEVVVGVLGHDGITLAVDVVVSLPELAETLAAVAPGSQVFFGAFPARDHDGVDAVTVQLPDPDGQVRPHPH